MPRRRVRLPALKQHLTRDYATGAGDENRTRMTSLEDETGEALARWFPYMRRKALTVNCRESPQWRGVLGTNWARDKSLFDLDPDQGSPSPSDRSQEIGAAIDPNIAERQYGATRAVLVSHRGRLVAERYYDSHVDDHAEVRSVTKSVMATLVGAALREGRLPSIDA
jgi:hypothetical protein